jgi:hypothetical protein
MERYEAILNQLKKAQSRGMETFTNRLDFVVQSLEELIQEAKSSVQGALPQSAEECLPIDEVEAALASYHQEAAAAEVRAETYAARMAELEESLESANRSASIELMRSLDQAESQSDLLRELLPALSEHAARAVVIVLGKESASAWSGIGFTDVERLRRWQGEVTRSPALSRLLEISAPVSLSLNKDPLFSSWLEEEEKPIEILLVPVVLHGKTMGAIYLDRFDDRPWSPDAAQSLIALACWLIDTLQFRTRPAPMLATPTVLLEAPGIEIATEEPAPTEPDDSKEFDEGVSQATAESEPETVESPRQEVGESEPADEEPSEIEISEGEIGEVIEDMDLDTESLDDDPSATVRISALEGPAQDDAPLSIEDAVGDDDEGSEPSDHFELEEPTEVEVVSEPEPAFEPDPAEVIDIESEEVGVGDEPAAEETIPTAEETPGSEHEEQKEESSPTGFLQTPPPVEPVQPPPDEPEVEISEDEAQQEEARRFARLLVSEIKLYNEEQVERGREAKDIYRRLKEDIDRSREMFEKRIAPEVWANQDFFQDELVRILADGDPDALGS